MEDEENGNYESVNKEEPDLGNDNYSFQPVQNSGQSDYTKTSDNSTYKPKSIKSDSTYDFSNTNKYNNSDMNSISEDSEAKNYTKLQKNPVYIHVNTVSSKITLPETDYQENIYDDGIYNYDKISVKFKHSTKKVSKLKIILPIITCLILICAIIAIVVGVIFHQKGRYSYYTGTIIQMSHNESNILKTTKTFINDYSQCLSNGQFKNNFVQIAVKNHNFEKTKYYFVLTMKGQFDEKEMKLDLSLYCGKGSYIIRKMECIKKLDESLLDDFENHPCSA